MSLYCRICYQNYVTNMFFVKVVKRSDKEGSLVSVCQEEVVCKWSAYVRRECVHLSLGCEFFVNFCGEAFEYWVKQPLSPLLSRPKQLSHISEVAHVGSDKDKPQLPGLTSQKTYVASPEPEAENALQGHTPIYMMSCLPLKLDYLTQCLIPLIIAFSMT